MAQDPKDQQKTDAQRIPDKGTGKVDQERLAEGIQHPMGGQPGPGAGDEEAGTSSAEGSKTSRTREAQSDR
jgi:hypothetical protein